MKLPKKFIALTLAATFINFAAPQISAQEYNAYVGQAYDDSSQVSYSSGVLALTVIAATIYGLALQTNGGHHRHTPNQAGHFHAH